MCPLYGGCPLFRGFCFKFKFIDRDILCTIAPAVSHFLKRSAIGRCPLMEVPLYNKYRDEVYVSYTSCNRF